MKFSEVLEVSNGSEAIELLKEEPIDMVILDLYLLDVSGFDVLEYIRNREVDSDIPVLVVTGDASKDEIVKAADLGATDYLLKPFQSDGFKSKVKKILNKYHSPSAVVRHLRRAERLFFGRRYEEALPVIEAALKTDPDGVRARHLKAITLDKLGKEQEALEILNGNISLNDSFYKTFASLAEIYLRLGKTDEAINAMSRELELNPKQPRRQTQLATLLLKNGNIDTAINHFREALKENVKFRLALFGMGRAYAMMNNLEKAVYYYRRVRRYYPTNTKALEAIVKCCLDFKDPRRAEFTLRDEKNANKNRLDTYIVLAKFYLTQDNKKQALLTVEELLRLKADSVDGLKLKAAIHMRYDEFKPAIEIYQKILKAEDSAETRIQFGDVLIKCKRYLDAIVVLHGSFKHKFDFQKIYTRLATCYIQTNQMAKATLVFLSLKNRGLLDQNLMRMAERSHYATKTRRSVIHKQVAS